MNEREKKHLRIISICAVTIVVTCLCFGVAMHLDISLRAEKTIRYVAVIIVIISYVLIFLDGMIWLIYIWKKSVHNIQKCDDKLFDDLSKIYEIANDDISYENAYRLISYYYKDGGFVDDIVRTKQLCRLLRRYDFLKKNIEFDGELSQYLYSIFISLFAAELSSIMKEAYVISNLWGLILFLLKMFIVILMIVFFFFQRYSKRGNNGKYSYVLMEYEISVLKGKLDTSADNNELTLDEFNVLMMKQQLMHKILVLDAKKQKNIKSQEREQDVKEIEKLNLIVRKCKKNKIKDCLIGDIKISFYYKFDKKKKNTYMLVNEDYRKLYAIVKKYYDINIKDIIVTSNWKKY